jgi:SAM-dependent methyltransferase
MEIPLRGRSITEVQGFWDRRPCNIRHSPRPIGTREYFDEVEKRKYFVEPHILRFAEFRRWSGKRVLEIGCGIGTDTIQFARHGAWVTAVDLSGRSLEIARDRARLLGLESRIEFHEANAEELTEVVPPGPYDLVYSFGVIHHTPQPERVVQQIRYYVTPESTVKLMVYHRYSWKVLSIVLKYGKGRVWRWPQLISRYSEAQEGCPVTYTFTRREISELLARSGLKVTELAVEHIFPYRMSEYLQYRYEHVWYFRYMPEALFRWLEHHWGWHLCVTAIAARSPCHGV